jgi:hypothetical protein
MPDEQIKYKLVIVQPDNAVIVAKVRGSRCTQRIVSGISQKSEWHHSEETN